MCTQRRLWLSNLLYCSYSRLCTYLKLKSAHKHSFVIRTVCYVHILSIAELWFFLLIFLLVLQLQREESEMCSETWATDFTPLEFPFKSTAFLVLYTYCGLTPAGNQPSDNHTLPAPPAGWGKRIRRVKVRKPVGWDKKTPNLEILTALLLSATFMPTINTVSNEGLNL